jgi:hypothetical protein
MYFHGSYDIKKALGEAAVQLELCNSFLSKQVRRLSNPSVASLNDLLGSKIQRGFARRL